MKKQFVCLANSNKLQGRCVAGIEMSSHSMPIINNANPKWIRPVSSNLHGEISTDLVTHLNLLDIIEIETTQDVGNGFQSENVLFNDKSLNKIGTLDYDNLFDFCSNSDDPKIFGNRGKSVHEEVINLIDHSLLMLCIEEFEIDSTDLDHLRLNFSYNGHDYDLPITDPVFIDNFKKNNDILAERSEIFVTISLAVEHNGWHSKLIAGII